MSEESKNLKKAVESARRGTIDADGMTHEIIPVEDTSNYPWERQPGEPNFWYDIFFRYYTLLGPSRNITAAYRAYAKAEEGFDATGMETNPMWRFKAHEWNWKIRAEAFDEFQRIKDAELWEQRKRELREKEWGVANELLSQAEGSLASRSSYETVKGPQGRVQNTPLKPRDITGFASTGSKLGRLASGMATDQTQHINIQARIEEVRKQRWDNVQDLLDEVVEGEYEYVPDDDIAGKDVMDETIIEPPKGLVERD